MPRRWFGFLFRFPLFDLEFASTIGLDGLKSSISNRDSFTGHHVADPECVFGLSSLANSDGELPIVLADVASQTKNVPGVSVMPLLEGPRHGIFGCLGLPPKVPRLSRLECKPLQPVTTLVWGRGESRSPQLNHRIPISQRSLERDIHMCGHNRLRASHRLSAFYRATRT